MAFVSQVIILFAKLLLDCAQEFGSLDDNITQLRQNLAPSKQRLLVLLEFARNEKCSTRSHVVILELIDKGRLADACLPLNKDHLATGLAPPTHL